MATCDPARGEAPGVVRDAVLIAAGERILFAGPSDAAPPIEAHLELVDIDARGAALVPGFVDAHTHITWLGDRAGEYALRASGASYEAIAAAGGGIRSTVQATAAGTVEEIRDAAAARARRMLRGGTTTVEVKSGYGLAWDAELRQLDAAAALRALDAVPDVVVTYLALHASVRDDRAAYIDRVVSHDVPLAAQRAAFCDVFCDAGAYSVEECGRVLEAAQAAGMGVKVHTEQLSRSGGVGLAASLGAASADHLEHIDDGGIRSLVAADVVGVLLPGAALSLGGAPPPGRRLLDAGATIAIATDCNPGTCYSESMALMMSLAVATSGLTPAEALVAATRGGAAALRLGDRGVIRAGARCDLVLLDTPNWVDLAYHLGEPGIRAVVSRGRVVERAAAPATAYAG